VSRLTSHRLRAGRITTLDRGQATVEFALLLPLFVLLMVALLDVVAIARDQLHVDMLARDAARRASQASNIDEARESVTMTIANVGRSDTQWQLTVNEDMLTVHVSMEPRTSLMTSSLRWLGGVRRIEGWASFVTEYDITDK
jgi:Flp pilus assembly protein TadG